MEDSDVDNGSEPWYGNDVDRAEYYGIDNGPPSPCPTQYFADEDYLSSTESELDADIKRSKKYTSKFCFGTGPEKVHLIIHLARWVAKKSRTSFRILEQ